ncbi:hypothetical protein [Shewanella halifaxensis]|uniref:hypothetical protein n=1 Tax=Shewanella halifaxensis TaxID=271098 RepID=UPI0003169F88|nr:hypothetical protein [Shewanella halifaxensis]
MEPNKVESQEPMHDADIMALLSELNKKRLKLLVLTLGVIAGIPAGFYGARWLYQLFIPAT